MAKHKGEFTLTFKLEGKEDPSDPDRINWDLSEIRLGGVEGVNPDDIWGDICNAILTAMSYGKAKL